MKFSNVLMIIYSVCNDLHCLSKMFMQFVSLVKFFPHMFFFFFFGFQTISELGIDSGGQSSATPKSRVTSAVRRRGACPSVGGHGSTLSVVTPSGENVSRPSVPLLHNTGGIFETLESHQVYKHK